SERYNPNLSHAFCKDHPGGYGISFKMSFIKICILPEPVRTTYPILINMRDLINKKKRFSVRKSGKYIAAGQSDSNLNLVNPRFQFFVLTSQYSILTSNYSLLNTNY